MDLPTNTHLSHFPIIVYDCGDVAKNGLYNVNVHSISQETSESFRALANTTNENITDDAEASEHMMDLKAITECDRLQAHQCTSKTTLLIKVVANLTCFITDICKVLAKGTSQNCRMVAHIGGAERTAAACRNLHSLLQISTRTEDFIVDTLKLRVHIGPYLPKIFKDPTKKKVMHGADKDILWLQRDFGIYV
ncbi:3'-5' exonuclease domain-containing protein [Cynara cardunculus var. scolymus]|uniref:3'-5' exonuclease domain-containing protein n=1 Tax=Cynara cardunculus var. scolymus TaxID=59895 RepID=A0A103PW57_CYNCS|nr:3'-5' exonuclease domain-containing protein [Cynara cardunculus var. scolymus]